MIKLDRPKVNALNAEFGEQLCEAVKRIDQDDSTKSLVIWGGPQIFSAGADLKEFPVGDRPRDPQSCVESINEAFGLIEKLGIVTVAAINGGAFGAGLELALSTDFRVCATDSSMGLVEVTLGLIPGAGGSQRLGRVVGPARAREMMLLGIPVDSNRAYDIGLVTAVVEPDEVLGSAIKLAEKFDNAPAAVSVLKELLRNSEGMDQEAGLALEQESFHKVFQTQDAVTGINAFLNSALGEVDFKNE